MEGRGLCWAAVPALHAPTCPTMVPAACVAADRGVIAALCSVTAACCFGSWTPCCVARRAWAAGRWGTGVEMCAQSMLDHHQPAGANCAVQPRAPALLPHNAHARLDPPAPAPPCRTCSPPHKHACATPPLLSFSPGGQPGAGGRRGRAGGHAQPGRCAGGLHLPNSPPMRNWNMQLVLPLRPVEQPMRSRDMQLVLP